jgi:sulfite oxidase
MGRFGKRDDLVIHQQEPFNAETGVESLGDAVTDTDAFYVRGHGAVPEIDPAAWRLRVDGMVGRELSLSLATLREAFREQTVIATLQCAGNRRSRLMAIRDIPGEAPWGPGATGTAVWTGAALADVLALAGPLPGASDVGFEGADLSPEAQPAQRFGGSIPLDKASRSEVLLAWAMNGAPLAAVHGAPLRAVVPGYIGARSVKWLERVLALAEPSDGHFQARSYRLLAADVDPKSAPPGSGVALGTAPLTADILEPADGATVPSCALDLHGYAYAGDDRRIVRVDVSTDDGATWRQAELLADAGPWAWRRWQATVTLPEGRARIVARAWDSAGSTQPEDPAHLWNPKGYVNSSWARIELTVKR